MEDMFTKVIDKEVSTQLPKKYNGQLICLKMVGGAGDLLVSAGSVANYLKDKDCRVEVACLPNMVPFASLMEGVERAFSAQDLNSVTIQQRYDCIVDFQYTFNSPKQLKAEDYYSLVEKRTGIAKLPLPRFKNQRDINLGSKVVALHPGASNPNRRWPNFSWHLLAEWLLRVHVVVIWLGARDEFGIVDYNSTKLSDTYPKLADQVKYLTDVSPYFAGNDSGFAHIAGVLGLKGVVIFGNTFPSDVIGRYETLKGIAANTHEDSPRTFHTFETGNIERIQAEEVFLELVKMMPQALRNVRKPVRETLFHNLEDRELTEGLNEKFNLIRIEEDKYPRLIKKQNALIIMTRTNKVIHVMRDNLENTARALRGVLEVEDE